MESVEDEWERKLESDDDLDLLFVRYNPRKIGLEQLKETVAKFEFEVEIRDDAKQ